MSQTRTPGSPFEVLLTMTKISRQTNHVGDGRVRWRLSLRSGSGGSGGSGTVRMTTSTISRSESAGRVELTATRSGGGSGPATVRYRTVAGSAAEGRDFAASSGTLTWGAGEQGARTFTVDLLDDLEPEPTERFTVLLEDVTGATLGSRASTLVEILDDEPAAGVVTFLSDALLVEENSGAATVMLERLGGSQGAVSVEIATRSLGATPGEDYEPPTAAVTWADGESRPQAATVQLLDDTEPEGTELFEVTLDGVSGGAAVGAVRSTVVALRDDDSGVDCTFGETRHCLSGGRFAVELFWRDPRSANFGAATTRELSDQSGLFWFFDEENIELIVKILDGTAINDSFWIFYGGVTTLELWIVAADTQNGLTRVYHELPGRPAARNDIGAFPQTGSRRPQGAGAPSSRHFTTVSLPSAPDPDPHQCLAESGAPAATCSSSDSRLCLTGDRFEVEVTWVSTRQGTSGRGTAIPLTSDSGLFWFFDEENIELVVKVLDARVVNGHFWLFYGALSDVEYSIRVTDTTTGEVLTFVNPEGFLGGDSDTQAFE